MEQQTISNHSEAVQTIEEGAMDLEMYANLIGGFDPGREDIKDGTFTRISSKLSSIEKQITAAHEFICSEHRPTEPREYKQPERDEWPYWPDALETIGDQLTIIHGLIELCPNVGAMLENVYCEIREATDTLHYVCERA